MIPPLVSGGFIQRGSARTPGADPTRLATGLDLRAVSIVEGIRAGLAAAVPVAASVWFGQPVLTLAALGALMTCICDPAGPMRRRLPLLLSFVVIGGVFMGGFGVIRQGGLAATLAAAGPALFALSYARVLGQPAQALGNLLAITLILGSDDPTPWQEGAEKGVVFMAGGLWALVLTLVIWRIQPYAPARRAVADVWAELAAMTRAAQSLAQSHAEAAAWEAQARAGRGAVRAAIERARDVLMETVDARGPSSGPAAQNLVRLEAADQVFAALIGLTDVLEHARSPDVDAEAAMLRRVRALLRVLVTATENERIDRAERFDRTLASLASDAELHPSLRHYATLLADRLRDAARLIEPAQYLPGSGQQAASGVPLAQRFFGPLQANLSWQSASFRHALRSTVVVGGALAGTLYWHGPYTHWFTITLVLVMQPFFALTWQRSLERVAGTLLGGLVAGGLSTVLRSQLHVAGVLPVLGALALAVRQVSYGVYIAVYTPTVIFLVESIRPGQSQVQIALARAGFTVAGGLLAVAANFLLWPVWQPDAVRRDLGRALSAHADLAEAVLLANPGASATKARRAAGLASNNLEAALARAMQEPKLGRRDTLQTVLVADATLRRIAGRLVAMSLEGHADPTHAAWAAAALRALAEDQPLPVAPQSKPAPAMERLGRQIRTLEETLRKVG
jgi:uncharacterized membrane protein YccC